VLPSKSHYRFKTGLTCSTALGACICCIIGSVVAACVRPSILVNSHSHTVREYLPAQSPDYRPNPPRLWINRNRNLPEQALRTLVRRINTLIRRSARPSLELAYKHNRPTKCSAHEQVEWVVWVGPLDPFVRDYGLYGTCHCVYLFREEGAGGV
jgi:hypothetical protein